MELTEEQQLLKTIIEQAWEDEYFKQELMTSPIPAIEGLIGEKLNIPAGKKIVVTDQSDPNTIHMNIPIEPDWDDMELTEEQLEVVAGGGTPVPPVITDPSSNLNGISDGQG